MCVSCVVTYIYIYAMILIYVSYVPNIRDGTSTHARVHARAGAQARGATPELRFRCGVSQTAPSTACPQAGSPHNHRR